MDCKDIHAVMIQDKVRTSTYASFILTNPAIFRDAVVLDVGCGTGILSLFAARGGAKRVIAVDASDITEKAERIVKANGFDDVITCVFPLLSQICKPRFLNQMQSHPRQGGGYCAARWNHASRYHYFRMDGLCSPVRIHAGFCFTCSGPVPPT